MGCDDKNQSAIAETADQLFLDTADGGRLDVVTSNLGVVRAGVTFDDDEWRAVGKLVALQPKQILERFYRMIELCIGPQFARIGTLAQAAHTNDRQLKMVDPSPFIQLGTITIDPTLATEETVVYCRRDLTTGTFFLQSALRFNHTPIAMASTFLTADAPAGSGTLSIGQDVSAFPTAPFPLIIGRGTVEEEVVQCTAIVAGTATLASNTVNDHTGPTTLFYTSALTKAAPAGRTFLQFGLDGTRGFPATGWVRVAHGGGSDEVVQYEENDVVNNVLFLKTPLVNSHAVGQHAELVRVGDLVEVCPVIENGIHWSVWETAPREVQVIVPKDLRPLSAFDATWMHTVDDGSPGSTTLANNVAPTERTVRITNIVAGMHHDAGMVMINGLGPFFYTLLIEKAEMVSYVATTAAAGVSALNYDLDPLSRIGFPMPQTEPYWVIIDEGGGNQETVQVRGTTLTRLSFLTPLANPHTAGETIQTLNQIILDRPTAHSFTAGQTVAVFQLPYAGTLLPEGNPRDSGGVVQLNEFAGGYIYDPSQRGVSDISTLLTVPIPTPTAVAAPSVTASTNLEVADASLWPAPSFTPFQVRIGENTGFQEDRTCLNRVLKKDAAATTHVTIVGATTMAYTLTSTDEFPESDGVHLAGYRVIFDEGGAHEEIATIFQNNTGTHTFTFVAGLTQPHGAGETITLLNDVLTFDILNRPHAGPRYNPSRLGDPVHAFTTELRVSPTPTDFPTVNGFIWLNFGKEVIDVRKRIKTITSVTSYKLQSTATMPTSGYPYPLVLSPGQLTEETVFVSNNNGIDTLTFVSPGAVNTHHVREYAQFTSGEPEVVEYNSKVTGPDRLLFAVPQLLSTRHLIGERVTFSPAISQSHSDGSSYGFKLPPDPSGCLTVLFELVRAAGIKVELQLK